MRFLADSHPGYDLTYDDVFMAPRRSAVTSRAEVGLTTADGTGTTIPLVVANMTAVAGRRMAETVARRGGLTVIPQDIPLPVVTEVIDWVKQRHPVFDTAVHVTRGATVGEALSLMPKRAHGAVVVLDDAGRPVGIATEADCAGVDRFAPIGEVMSEELLTLPADVTARSAFDRLSEGRHRLAPVVAPDGTMIGILTRLGALRAGLYAPAVDAAGRLRIAAAVGIGGEVADKAATLLEAGVDCLVVDTAHGHQDRMLDAVRAVRALDGRAGGGRQRGHRRRNPRSHRGRRRHRQGRSGSRRHVHHPDGHRGRPSPVQRRAGLRHGRSGTRPSRLGRRRRSASPRRGAGAGRRGQQRDDRILVRRHLRVTG